MELATAVLILVTAAAIAAAIACAVTARRARQRADAAQRSRPLEGELVAVNTPRPDDQSLRGIVRQELPNGGLVLTAAALIERSSGRGGETVVESPIGDVYVPVYSWAQIVQATQPTPLPPAAGQ